MRAFLALPVAGAATEALLRLQGTLPYGRPVPEENLHLTLAFLGEADPNALHGLHDLLSVQRLPAPQIGFGALGTFAEMQRGIVYAEVLPDPILIALQARVAQAARSAGADLPRRRFRPHVTLMRAGRQPKGPARDRLAAALGMPCRIPGYTAGTLCLYRSELTPTGARHEVMAGYRLN